MKKLVVLALGLLASLSTFAGPQGEDNGLGLKFFAGFHSWKYGTQDLGALGLLVDEDKMPKASPTLGMALDSRWYVANPGKGPVSIAINARWLDFSYARLKETNDSRGKIVTTTTTYWDASMLGIGAIGTYYFDDKMAVDLYYNIMPNAMITVDSNSISDDKETTYSFGSSHRIGAAYRFKVFQAGFEIKGGKLKIQDWGKSDAEKAAAAAADNTVNNLLGIGNKIRTGSFRIFLGFKF